MKKLLGRLLVLTTLAISASATTRIYSPQDIDRPAVGEVVIVDISSGSLVPEKEYTMILAWIDAHQDIHPILVTPHHTNQRKLTEWKVPAEKGGTLIVAVFDTVLGAIVDIHAVKITISPQPTEIFGDFNNDGKVTDEPDMVMLDKFMAFQNINGRPARWTEGQLFKADFNLDGKVDSRDENLMAEFLVDSVSELFVWLPLGDVNGDGKISGTDIVMIRRHILGIQPLKNPKIADVDGDGTVSTRDISIIRNHIINLWPNR